MSRVISTSGGLVFNASSVKVGSNNVLDASAIGISLQAYSDKLADIAGLTPNSGDVLKWDGSNFVAGSELDPIYSTDDSTLETVSNVYSVKDDGITAAKLASQNLKDVAGLSSMGAGDVVAYDGSNLVKSSNYPKLNSGNTFSSGIQVMQDVTAINKYNLQGSGQSGYSYVKNFEFQTTDITPNVSAAITLDADSTSFCEAHVSVCDDTSGDACAYHLYSVDSRMAGVNSGDAVSKSKQDEIIFEDTNLANCMCIFNLSGNSLRVACTGVSANLRWHVSLAVRNCPKYSA
jgi:hypothetical protein